MKCLFILSIALDKPGPSVHLLKDIMISFMNQGHSVVVVSRSNNISGLETFGDGKYDDRLTSYSVKEKSDKKSGFLFRYLNEIYYASSCAKIYRKFRDIDVVFLQSTTVGCFHTCLIKKYINKPIVFNVQDIFPYNLKYSGQLPLSKITFRVFRWLQHKAYNQSDRIVTISEDMKNTLSGDGVPTDKIDVIYNWSYSDEPIRLDDIPQEFVKNIMIDNGKFNVVYAGNIGKMQNVEIVARTAKLCEDDPTTHFYIIGDGSNKAKIIEITKNLSNVTILPMQLPMYAESIYAQASVNIIPLIKGGIFTALPSKTATCLRTGNPIIFCVDKNSAFSDVFHDHDGIYIADCNDEFSLKEMINLIKEKGMEKYSGMELLSEHFSKKNAEKYFAVLENLYSGKIE